MGMNQKHQGLTQIFNKFIEIQTIIFLGENSLIEFFISTSSKLKINISVHSFFKRVTKISRVHAYRVPEKEVPFRQ